MFDRSNIYVAVSRPIQFLGVIGTTRTIRAMVMRDPPTIRSGLFMYLDDNGNGPNPENTPFSGHWKHPRREATEFAVNLHLAFRSEEEGSSLFNQTHRTAFPVPTAVCSTSYQAWSRAAKRAREKMDKKQLAMYDRQVEDRSQSRLYGSGMRMKRDTDPMTAEELQELADGLVPMDEGQEEEEPEEEEEILEDEDGLIEYDDDDADEIIEDVLVGELADAREDDEEDEDLVPVFHMRDE